MTPPSTSTTSRKKKKVSPAIASREVGTTKSPAEFFAENQSIAGFDNPGKSLYTTIRELVENSLDACESARILPNVSLVVEEMNQAQFNVLRGRVQDCCTKNNSSKSRAGANTEGKDSISNSDIVGTSMDSRFDAVFKGSEIFENVASSIKRKASKSIDSISVPEDDTKVEESYGNDENEEKKDDKKAATKKKKKLSVVELAAASQQKYYRVTVRDNGCGMSHDSIPQLLGRVLSSSKYGIRQTRGKFGLGAKMALIWSKKSTGVPIRVKSLPMAKQKKCVAAESATSMQGDDENKNGNTTNEKRRKDEETSLLSTCVLDIDIYKNEPRVLFHEQSGHGAEQFRAGTEITLVIGGNWTTYKSRIVQYLHQLAIITPYAKLTMKYLDLSTNAGAASVVTGAGSGNSSRDMTIRYDRRSDQMPEPAREVRHHPSSINNLLVQRLLEQTKTQTMEKFLCKELNGVTFNLTKKFFDVCGESLSGAGINRETVPSTMDDAQISRLVQGLQQHSYRVFRPPDASCLSPLGEYNLNLGIRKVVEPDLVATARDKPGAYEGHPFLVEAAVALGGTDSKEGITVIRFANRIPLLFEAGADVVTRVAQSKIKWSSYKIDSKRDKIGVFVSIVSTKIPFKGTGKEYIGDDIFEIQHSVKRTLQSCCQQLRAHLIKKNALRDIKERQSRLVKYIPDVSRAVFGLLNAMGKRRIEGDKNKGKSQKRKKITESSLQAAFLANPEEMILEKIQNEKISEASLKDGLFQAIKAQQSINFKAAVDSPRKQRGLLGLKAKPLFLVPITHNLKDVGVTVEHPLFSFRPMQHVADKLLQPNACEE